MLLLPPSPPLSFPVKPLSLSLTKAHHHHHLPRCSSSSSSSSIPMFLSSDGSYSSTPSPPLEKKVVVLWDLDNKPPRGPPFDAALHLRRLASLFGSVLHVSAYANRHAFLHLPPRVLLDRRLRRDRDALERLQPPADPYPCAVCGRKFPTHAALRKHFVQLHQRERNKKLARLRSLKGKRRRRYRDRFLSGNSKYDDAEQDTITPRTGYGLARDLRRAGVSVRTVADKPQAADAALKRQMQHSITCGVDWMFLVSDDSDFAEMMRRARESEMRTVVVGDWKTAALARLADIWVPWAGVESGEVGEEVMRAGGWRDGVDWGRFEGGRGLDAAVDEIVAGVGTMDLKPVGVPSAFSEEEVIGGSLDDDDFRIYGSAMPGDEFFWDSEEDDDDDEF